MSNHELRIANYEKTPALVFIHGAGSSSDFWREQRAAFPDACYLDLPGHGKRILDHERRKSKIENPEYDIAAYVGWVQEYVEESGLANVVLDGHSMGGGIVLTLALGRPAWLRAIVLTGTGARLRVRPDILELARTDYPAAVDLIIEMSFASVEGEMTYKQRIRRNGTRRQMLRTPPEITLADYASCNSFDVMSQLGEIAVPTLCIVGAEDQMTPLKYSEYLHKAIAGSRLEIVQGAGHMLPLEQPDEYNRRLAEFLARLS